MRKRISVLIVLSALVLLTGCAKQTTDQESEFEPEPLVIENSAWEPNGTYYGTVVISGEGMEDICYEGAIFIEMDGKYIRISCTDAVRSRFAERF